MEKYWKCREREIEWTAKQAMILELAHRHSDIIVADVSHGGPREVFC